MKISYFAALLAVVALLAVPACKGDKDAADKESAAGESAEKKEEPPKPFEGEFTVEVAKSVSDGVYQSWSFKPWDQSIPKIESKLGKATKAGEDGTLYWVAADKTTCLVFEAEKKDGQAWVSKSEVAMPEPRGIGELKGNLCRAAAGMAAPQ